MTNFSICLIARNEEKTLPRLLGSLEEFKARGGEVVLLDTGSTDSTAQVARDWGCKVEEVGDRFVRVVDEQQAKAVNERFKETIIKEGDKNFDFSSARNYCASLASNDMISMPDCDEIVTSMNIDALNALIRGGCEQIEFNFVFAHGPNGEETIKFIQCKFYNRTKMKWVGIIHEVLQGEANRTLVSEEVLKIEHYQNEETNRKGYLVGLALDCYENPTNDRNCHYFARELMYRGFLKPAIQEFRRHLEISTWDAERSQSLIHIGDCLIYLNAEDDAIIYFFKGYLEYPHRREALIKLGQYFMRKKEYAKAVFFFEGALRIQYSGFYGDDRSHYSDYLYGLLYIATWWLGDKVKSKEYFDIALDMNPTNPVYLAERHFYYGEYGELPFVSILIPTLKRQEGLKRCLDSIERINYPKDKLEVLVQEDEPRLGVAKRLNDLFDRSQGEFVVYGSNDIEFDKDSIMNAVREIRELDGYDLLAFNTGQVLPDDGNICEHFMVRSSYVSNSLGGKIFDEDFNHVGVDNLLWNQTEMRRRSTSAVIKHYHFSTGEEMDEVYKLGWSKVDEDRELLKNKLNI